MISGEILENSGQIIENSRKFYNNILKPSQKKIQNTSIKKGVKIDTEEQLK